MTIDTAISDILRDLSRPNPRESCRVSVSRESLWCVLGEVERLTTIVQRDMVELRKANFRMRNELTRQSKGESMATNERRPAVDTISMNALADEVAFYVSQDRFLYPDDVKLLKRLVEQHRAAAKSIDALRARVAELEGLLKAERDEEDQRRMDRPF